MKHGLSAHIASWGLRWMRSDDTDRAYKSYIPMASIISLSPFRELLPNTRFSKKTKLWSGGFPENGFPQGNEYFPFLTPFRIVGFILLHNKKRGL